MREIYIEFDVLLVWKSENNSTNGELKVFKIDIKIHIENLIILF